MNETIYKYLSFNMLADMSNWSVRKKIIINTAFSNAKKIKLSKLIHRVKKAVYIEENREYKRVTIKLYGRGVVLRDIEIGKNIGTKRQFRVESGQFILSRIDARNGAFGIVPDELNDAIITNDFWVFNISPLVDPKYLMLLLSSDTFQDVWANLSSGATNRQRIEESNLLDIDVFLPELDVQKKIVDSFFSMLSKADVLELEAEEVEKNIKITVEKELGIINEQGNKLTGLNIVKFSSLQKWGVDFLLSNNTVFHKKYKSLPLSKLCDISSGGTPSRKNKRYFNGDIPWVKTGEVINDVIFETEEKITEEALKNSSAKKYPPGSLIIAMYGQGATRGRTAKLGVEATTNQACAVLFNVDKAKIKTDYLWVYLMNEYDRLRALASGNNQPNLNAQIIKNYEVIIPPLEIQEKLVSEVFNMREKMKKLQLEAEELRSEAKNRFKECVFGEA